MKNDQPSPQNLFAKFQAVLGEYPGQFWLLMMATFIDLLGGFLIFPFFSLYFTEKFAVSLTEVGFIYGIWSVTGILGRTLGGALADRIGRKRMVIIGLVFSALSSLALALATDFVWIYISAAIGGLFSSSGGPARQAMVADVLPKDQYNDGFGILRVVANIAFAIGPAVGGLLANISFTLLFFIDATTSILAAFFILRFLRETQPTDSAAKVRDQRFGTVLRGYGAAFKDWRLVAITFLGGLIGLTYFQWYFAVPVFMRDVHGFPPEFYGSLMGFAGVLVVFLQLPITRKTKAHSPLVLMAAGSLFFAVGFGMLAFISALGFFIAAFAIITVGEMIFYPTQQAIVARLAPEDMRGRYMAAAGLGFSIPNIVGPSLGGLILDRADPNLLWYAGSLLCFGGMVVYLALNAPFKAEAASSVDGQVSGADLE